MFNNCIAYLLSYLSVTGICRADIKTILRTVIGIQQILLNRNTLELQEDDVKLDLPICSVANLHIFNTTLCEDSATRLQYVSILYQQYMGESAIHSLFLYLRLSLIYLTEY